MRKILYFIISFATIIGCNKEDEIIPPTIILDHTAKAFEPLCISVSDFTTPHGANQNYFDWSILNENGETVESDFENSDSIHWTPIGIGLFTISVNISYGNNKSFSVTKKIKVIESPASFQKRLVGKWTGEAVKSDLKSWKFVITYDSIGHYTSKVYERTYLSFFLIGALYGTYRIEDPNGDIMSVEPSEDVPCTRFQINEVIDYTGYGIFTVGNEIDTRGDPYGCWCDGPVKFKDLQFSTDGQKLSFSVPESEILPDLFITKFNLTRIE